jgi:hypothetical protein
MKRLLLPVGLCTLLLPGCLNTALVRGDCEFMIPDEQRRCHRANESNRQIVAERMKVERSTRESRGEFDKEKLESVRDQ